MLKMLLIFYFLDDWTGVKSQSKKKSNYERDIHKFNLVEINISTKKERHFKGSGESFL